VTQRQQKGVTGRVTAPPALLTSLNATSVPAAYRVAIWQPTSTAPMTVRKFPQKPRESHDIHAPFRVTTHHGHTVQTFQSLELALEAAEALGPDHYVTDHHGFQIWNPQRKLLRSEE